MRFGANGEVVTVKMLGGAASASSGPSGKHHLDPAPFAPLTQYTFVHPHEARAEITGYSVGAIGRLVELHAAAYHHRCGYDVRFEIFVARELADFISKFDPACDGLWLYKKSGSIVGAIAIDGQGAAVEGARLRFLIVHPAHQGRGVGRVLMENAIAFCKDRSMSKIFLWTDSTLYEARQLYEQFGFTLSEERMNTDWGVASSHQRFHLTLSAATAGDGR